MALVDKLHAGIKYWEHDDLQKQIESVFPNYVGGRASYPGEYEDNAEWKVYTQGGDENIKFVAVMYLHDNIKTLITGTAKDQKEIEDHIELVESTVSSWIQRFNLSEAEEFGLYDITTRDDALDQFDRDIRDIERHYGRDHEVTKQMRRELTSKRAYELRVSDNAVNYKLGEDALAEIQEAYVSKQDSLPLEERDGVIMVKR